MTCRKSGCKFYPQLIHKFSTFYSQSILNFKKFSISSDFFLSAHTPVMLHEAEEILKISSRKKYIDATLGMAGHASWFLHKNPDLQLIGFDHDPFARKKATEQLEKFSDRYEIIPKNFEHIREAKTQKKFSPDSILFDIGVSSLQFDTPERGFSFRFSAPLDMRMNPENSLTAEEIINTWEEKKLEKIFLEYGEESWARKIAEKIAEVRKISPLQATTDLAELVSGVKPFQKNRKKNAGGHPATLVFQALRIAVNREFEVLESALHAAIDILENNGRIAVITFHSLEDRIVKNIFASYENKGKQQKYPKKSYAGQKNFQKNFSPEILERGYYLEKCSKKPIIPSDAEVEKNPRARSAKLRCVEKKSI